MTTKVASLRDMMEAHVARRISNSNMVPLHMDVDIMDTGGLRSVQNIVILLGNEFQSWGVNSTRRRS